MIGEMNKVRPQSICNTHMKVGESLCECPVCVWKRAVTRFASVKANHLSSNSIRLLDHGNELGVYDIVIDVVICSDWVPSWSYTFVSKEIIYIAI